MSITSGFYNSLNGDRRYNADQMSAIFDGVINDGVFSGIGTAFAVTATTGTTVNVGIGRAWFNSTWLYNDAIYPVSLPEADLLLKRIDAIVIEINRDPSVRAGTIKAIAGVPSSSPTNPTLTNTEYIHQYPLAYISRAPGSTTVTQSHITNKVGTSECPYVTGILQVQSIDNVVAQWEAQWVEWFNDRTSSGSAEWSQWFADETQSAEDKTNAWMLEMKADFMMWFNSLQAALEPDVAASLADAITNLQSKFHTLIKDGCIYDFLLDFDGAMITDHLGTEIEARTLLLSETEIQLEHHISDRNNPHGVTPEQIGAAPEEHTHSADDVLGGTFSEAVKAASGTDYTVSKFRNISAGTEDLEAGVSALENGAIYLVYE